MAEKGFIMSGRCGTYHSVYRSCSIISDGKLLSPLKCSVLSYEHNEQYGLAFSSIMVR